MVAAACPSCGRNLPGAEAYRRERSGRRRAATWAIVLGLMIAVYGYLSEGGPRIIDTRWGRSTAGSLRVHIIVGLAFAAYGAFSLYRLREDAQPHVSSSRERLEVRSTLRFGIARPSAGRLLTQGIRPEPYRNRTDHAVASVIAMPNGSAPGESRARQPWAPAARSLCGGA
jgi:hypothetical protein